MDRDDELEVYVCTNPYHGEFSMVGTAPDMMCAGQLAEEELVKRWPGRQWRWNDNGWSISFVPKEQVVAAFIGHKQERMLFHKELK